jgi:hypothetical protein
MFQSLLSRDSTSSPLTTLAKAQQATNRTRFKRLMVLYCTNESASSIGLVKSLLKKAQQESDGSSVVNATT